VLGHRQRIGAWLVVAALVASWPAPASAAPPLEQGQHFQVDPVADGLVTATGVSLSVLLGAILSTGEIRPVASTVDPSALLPFDRVAVTQTIDPNAGTISNVIQWTATGFAVLDPLLSGLRDGWDALLVDALMYAESTSLTSALTDMLKIAVKRPRPYAYAQHSTATDAELSFPSGHASGVASVAATATYLAFVRSPRTARPWITLGVGTLLTAFVSYERVRAGAHFPTDVAAGSLLGASVGVLVPHLHRHEQEAPPVWVGVAPSPGGGSITLQGRF
jgi:undecaprenyl-diphosphatase